MDTTYSVLIIIIIVILYLINKSSQEQFASKREKAQAIQQWFTNNPTGNYLQYRDEIKKSNIVEYEDMRSLYSEGGNATADDIENKL